jgi:hypothetical protein
MKALLTVAFCLIAVSAVACPFCGTETSQQVRANIFNEDFWSNTALVLSPFPVLLLAVGLIARYSDRN